MLAGTVTGPGQIALVEVPEPQLDSAAAAPQIIFQPEVTCLCGSDIPFFDGSPEVPAASIGHSLHEMVGTVVATNGQRFQAGARVLAVPLDQRGLYERFALDQNRAIPLVPGQPDEHLMLAQPLGTVLFALKKLPQLLDADVAVVGQGPIGQMFNAALRNLGARHIIGIDPLPERLEHSRDMGATATICNADADPLHAIRKITGGQLPDIVIEAVGHGDQALNLCITLCRPAGRILYFGVPPETIDGVRWRDLMQKNLTVHTSINPSFERDFPLAMRWIAESRIDLTGLITHRFPLSQIQTAFETFKHRRSGALKVVVEFPSYTGRPTHSTA